MGDVIFMRRCPNTGCGHLMDVGKDEQGADLAICRNPKQPHALRQAAMRFVAQPAVARGVVGN